MNKMPRMIDHIYTDVLNGNHKDITARVKSALEAGYEPVRILNDGMIAAMSEVGRLFEAGEYYVPEMLVSARAMQTGMTVLRLHLMDTDAHPVGKVAIGTVEGDYHDIGKNLVKMMLEGAGFEVLDLGVDVSPDKFISAVKDTHVDILAMSALITTTMPNMRQVIQALERANLRPKVKVLVGGAPLTEDFAYEIGADAYAPDASRAVRVAKSLVAS